jgi:hypothetical protein
MTVMPMMTWQEAGTKKAQRQATNPGMFLARPCTHSRRGSNSGRKGTAEVLHMVEVVLLGNPFSLQPRQLPAGPIEHCCVTLLPTVFVTPMLAKA